MEKKFTSSIKFKTYQFNIKNENAYVLLPKHYLTK